MIMIIFPLVSLISFVYAQSSTIPSSSTTLNVSTTSGTPTSSDAFPSLSGYSPCVVQCLGLSVSAANCSSEVAVNCFCTSQNFTNKMVACISSTCPTQLGSAETLAQQFCNIASSSISLSFPFASVNATISGSAGTTTTTSIPFTTTAGETAPTKSSGAAALGLDVPWSVSVTGIGFIFGVLYLT